ncbi:beta-lactamase family protein [Pedobacter polaris]|uniref:Beta-lactamase family protein n=1 Tax=Pedobacter polaris TaxID=2571273 RepID=A0A4U1CY94_9SPHI|nr:serine hydrolase domain-containing protein [Pedobacter polaris]TKC12579.1 beta-lactamase family protein [Pedobacter polaris]
MIKKFTFTLALWVMYITVCSQVPNDNPLKTRLDSIVNNACINYFKNSKRVGFTLGFTASDKSYIYNYGETAPGSGKMPSAKSIYEIGSITKTFTGLLVANAVLEGKLKLTDDIRKYLPSEFINFKYPNGETVKVIYLLAHVAKLPKNFNENNGQITERIFLENFRAIKLDTLKEFKYSYSNIGYQLLGYVLEKIYQMPYQDLVQKYIANPLKMTNTKVSYEDNSQILRGYDKNKDEASATLAAFPSAGGLRSNITDMLKYLKYQLESKDELVKLTHRITSGDIDKEAHAIQWAIGKLWNWDYYLTTDGGTNGFRSFCIIYPDYKISFIILSNQTDENAGGGLYRITAAIFNELKNSR